MGGARIHGQAAFLRRAAFFIAVVFSWIAGCNGETNPQDGSTVLPIRGTYTFGMQVDSDGSCGWPVTAFIWPVSVEVTSSAQGTMAGSIRFPPTPSHPSNKWMISASATSTQLVPGEESPGPAAAAYNVVVDGGRWEAGGPTRALDGRAEITTGTASGARLTLVLPGSEERWECLSDAKWSLRIRYADPD